MHMDAQHYLSVFRLPSLSQSEWAAWIQVTGALVALFLAIYVPIRMRRIEELDRQRSVAACINMLCELGDYYLKTLPKSVERLGTPSVDFDAVIIATRAHMQNPATPPWLLPSMGHAVDAAEKMFAQWRRAALDSEFRKSGPAQRDARLHVERIVKQRDSINSATRKWRKKHWITLAFS